ncbi:NfeD family protein [Zavarzinia compransoris]|nr:NfeD family protein [Zavarzinia compransoris]TDP44982.1 hypothetical protein DES42_106203 [Zavarzinia compransoris]
MPEIVFWHWYALAAALVVLEVVVPGVLFLWLAIGAVVAGSLVFFIPGLDLLYQVLAFALASGLSLLFGHNMMRRLLSEPPAQAALNQRDQALIGAEAVLIEPIANGSGRVRLGDTSWLVAGPEAPVGTRVRVVAAEGTRLKVEVL